MKRVFLFRLLSYVNCRENVQQGLIPDVLNLLEKYQLIHVVHTYLSSSKFPSKFAWNRLLKNKLHSSAINAWHSRTLAQDFYRFRIIQPEFRPHWAWYFSKSRRKLLIPCISVVQMTANLTDVKQNNSACVACDSYYDNLVDHCLQECSSLVVDRAKLWHDISCISMNAYAFLNGLNNSLVSNALLSMTNADLNILCDEQDNCKHICVLNLHSMWKKYRSLTYGMRH